MQIYFDFYIISFSINFTYCPAKCYGYEAYELVDDGGNKVILVLLLR